MGEQEEKNTEITPCWWYCLSQGVTPKTLLGPATTETTTLAPSHKVKFFNKTIQHLFEPICRSDRWIIVSTSTMSHLKCSSNNKKTRREKYNNSNNIAARFVPCSTLAYYPNFGQYLVWSWRIVTWWEYLLDLCEKTFGLPKETPPFFYEKTFWPSEGKILTFHEKTFFPSIRRPLGLLCEHLWVFYEKTLGFSFENTFGSFLKKIFWPSMRRSPDLLPEDLLQNCL